MFDDHGVDDADDGVAVWLGEGFEGLEAAEQRPAETSSFHLILAA